MARSLSDLFVVGRELELDDGNGAIRVWVQKLNPIEHEKAMRRASSARAAVLSGKDSAELEMAQDEAAQYGKEGWVEFLAADVVGKKLAVLEAELSGEEEWSDQNYIKGLKDAWEDSAEQTLIDDPNDPEARRIRDELKRFTDELQRRVEGERDRAMKDLNARPSEDLERRVVDRLIGTRADLAWLTEFRRCQVWLSVRNVDNHLESLFKNREDVDTLSHEVLVRLTAAYQDLEVEPLEGKALGATQTSSKSSESPATEGTDNSSGPEAVSV